MYLCFWHFHQPNLQQRKLWHQVCDHQEVHQPLAGATCRKEKYEQLIFPLCVKNNFAIALVLHSCINFCDWL